MAETTTTKPKTRSRAGTRIPRHSPKRVDEGLLALLATGSSYQASEFTGIPDQTLRDWRHRYRPRYLELAAKHGPRLEAEALADLQEATATARAGAIEAVELERSRLKTGDVKDAAGSARNLATVVGILTEKSLLLQGKPTSVTEHAGTRDILKALSQRVPGLVIDSTAEEIPTDQHRLNEAQDTSQIPAA